MLRSVRHRPSPLASPNSLSETVWKIGLGPDSELRRPPRKAGGALIWPLPGGKDPRLRSLQLFSKQSLRELRLDERRRTPSRKNRNLAHMRDAPTLIRSMM